MVDYGSISEAAHAMVSNYPDMIRRGRISPDFIFDDLGFDIVPIPRLRQFARTLDIDVGTLLLLATKCVYVDESLLDYPRYNFSIAHELGHFDLHSKSFSHCASMKEFLESYLEFGVAEILEKEANVYASHLLMPDQLIVPALQNLLSTLDSKIKNILNKRNVDDNISSIAPALAPMFGVSNKAVYWRIFHDPTLREGVRELSQE